MSPTLLEFAVIIILLVVAWQLGLALAPSIMRWIRALKDDIDRTSSLRPILRPAGCYGKYNIGIIFLNAFRALRNPPFHLSS